MKKFLGVDCGRARIGLAIADDSAKIATPLKTVAIASWVKATKESIANDDEAILQIVSVVDNEQIQKVIFGIPIDLQGEENENCEEIREFALALETALSEKENKVEIDFHDERFSTVQAHSQLHEVGKQPSKEREIVDQLAAVNILQSWIDLKKGEL